MGIFASNAQKNKMPINCPDFSFENRLEAQKSSSVTGIFAIKLAYALLKKKQPKLLLFDQCTICLYSPMTTPRMVTFFNMIGSIVWFSGCSRK